jgi:hypothetical protein
MKKYFSVFMRRPHETEFRKMYDGSYDADEVVTWQMLVDRAKKPDSFWLPNAEFLVVKDGSGAYLRAVSELRLL